MEKTGNPLLKVLPRTNLFSRGKLFENVDIILRFLTLAAIFFIPFSTVLTNVFMLTVIALFPFSKAIRSHWRLMYQHPISRASLALFIILSLSIIWGDNPLNEELLWLIKYRKILFIPVLIIVFAQCYYHKLIKTTLMLALLINLLISTTNYFRLTSIGSIHSNTGMGLAWVNKDHITMGLLTTLLFGICIFQARSMWISAINLKLKNKISTIKITYLFYLKHIFYLIKSNKLSWLFYALSILCLANIFIMLKGRTGQVACFGLIIVFGYQYIKQFYCSSLATGLAPKKLTWLFIVLISFSILLCLLQFSKSSITRTKQEYSQYESCNEPTSVGLRIEFYNKSLKLFKERPWFGYGVSCVEKEFEKLKMSQRNASSVVIGNVHNQYLQFAIETGLIGLFAFFYLIIETIKAIRRSSFEESKTIVSVYLFIFIIGSNFNSLILDFTEGNLFVLLIGTMLAPTGITNKTKLV